MKEPFVRLIKRDGATMRHKIIVRIVAILLALVVDAIFIYGVTGLNPLAAVSYTHLDVYKRQEIDGVRGSISVKKAWETMRNQNVVTLPITSEDADLQLSLIHILQPADI